VNGGNVGNGEEDTYNSSVYYLHKRVLNGGHVGNGEGDTYNSSVITYTNVF